MISPHLTKLSGFERVDISLLLLEMSEKLINMELSIINKNRWVRCMFSKCKSLLLCYFLLFLFCLKDRREAYKSLHQLHIFIRFNSFCDFTTLKNRTSFSPSANLFLILLPTAHAIFFCFFFLFCFLYIERENQKRRK